MILASRGAIIQAGVIKLVTGKPDLNHKQWGESWLVAIELLKECGVELVWTNVSDDTKWLGQYLIDDNLWYLSELGDDGIEGEHFFESKKEAMKYIEGNDITVEWEKVDDVCCDCDKPRGWIGFTTSKHRCYNCLEDYMLK